MRNWIDLLEKQISSDAPPAVLYHGTSLRSLIRILYLDALCPGCDDGDMEGTFCSGDPEVAKRYVEDASYNGPAGGVLTFNTASLRAAGIQIKSYFYHDFDEVGEEDDIPKDGEEWVLQNDGRDIRHLHKFVTNVDVLPASIDALRADTRCCLTDEWDSEAEYDDAVGRFLKRFG